MPVVCENDGRQCPVGVEGGSVGLLVHLLHLGVYAP